MAETPDSITLPDQFHDWGSSCIDEEGFGITKGIIRMAGGGLAMAVLHLSASEVYQHLLRVWSTERPEEIVFALDRHAAPNQGTTLDSLVAGWHFTKHEPRPFIIEYQHAPRTVKPIQWDNEWWNASLTSELLAHLRIMAGVTGWTLS